MVYLHVKRGKNRAKKSKMGIFTWKVKPLLHVRQGQKWTQKEQNLFSSNTNLSTKTKCVVQIVFSLIHIYLYFFQVNKYSIKNISVKTYSPVTSPITLR